MDHRELTLAELLADPVTLAVMAADLVDPAALKAMLCGLAGKISLAPLAEPRRESVTRNDQAW
jgi:hypothetical protein